MRCGHISELFNVRAAGTCNHNWALIS